MLAKLLARYLTISIILLPPRIPIKTCNHISFEDSRSSFALLIFFSLAMTSIKLTDRSTQSSEPINQTLCEICQKQFSNYVCPRCNLRYCSLACYKDKQHANCTESFYKDTILDEIKKQQVDNDSKAKMLEVLQRLEQENKNNYDYEEGFESDDCEDDLAQRFQNIDVNSADPSDLWDLLPDEQKKEFELLLKGDHWKDIVSTHLPTYTPWWTLPKQVILEESEMERTRKDDTCYSVKTPIPGLPITLPDFTKMAPQPATRSTPHILWNLAHILGTYSFLMRHTMGEPLAEADGEDVNMQVLDLISTLSAHVLFSQAATCPFKSINDVVVDLVEQITVSEQQQLPQQQQQQQVDPSNSINHLKLYNLKSLLLEDIKTLLYECKRALHHFWEILNVLNTHIKLKKNKKSFNLAARKLYFYLAAGGYLLEEDRDRVDMVRLSIENEILRVTTEREEFHRDVEAAKKAMDQQKRQLGDSRSSDSGDGVNNNKIEELL